MKRRDENMATALSWFVLEKLGVSAMLISEYNLATHEQQVLPELIDPIHLDIPFLPTIVHLE
jgi:hypothetical protein